VGIPVRQTPLCPKEENYMLYNPNIHKRHSIRLKKYNYTKEGMYFITICVQNRECLLGKIIEGKMQLNYIGKIVEKELINIQAKFQHLNIKIYQIMPNHIHIIVELEKENKITIGNIIRYFKGRVSSKTKKYWQRNYYEHIIRNEKEYYSIYNYIINNPLNWQKGSDKI
jgi:REP element-mobilizing transposase RayT